MDKKSVWVHFSEVCEDTLLRTAFSVALAGVHRWTQHMKFTALVLNFLDGVYFTYWSHFQHSKRAYLYYIPELHVMQFEMKVMMSPQSFAVTLANIGTFL